MPITFREYQIAARRTSGRNDVVYSPSPFSPLPRPTDTALITRLRTVGLGLVGEWGELCDLYKKIVGHGHPMDRAKIIKEAGDIAWYLAELHTCLGLVMGEEDVDKFQSDNIDVDIDAIDGTCDDSDVFDVVDTLLRGSGGISLLAVMVAGILDGDTDGTEAAGVQDDLDRSFAALAVILGALSIRFSEVLEANITKLKERYPEGFSNERSVNRTDT